MGDLGIKSSELYPSPTGPVVDEDKVNYPTLNLRQGQVDAAGLGECQVGDEYTATIRFRIGSKRSSASETNSDNEVGLDVLSIEDVQHGGEAAANPEDASAAPGLELEGEPEPEPTEEEVLGYARPNKSKKVPFGGAKSLIK